MKYLDDALYLEEKDAILYSHVIDADAVNKTKTIKHISTIPQKLHLKNLLVFFSTIVPPSSNRISIQNQ